MPTAPARATSKTMWRSGSRQDRVANKNSSMPPSRTQAIGTSALISQLIRNQGNSGSWFSPAPSSATASETEFVAASSLEYPVLNELLRAGRIASTGWASGSAGELLVTRAVSGISVQSRKKVRYSEESEHHNGKSENSKVSGPPAAPAAGNAHVQISGIHQPSNRRPRLFGVPIPRGATGPVSPVGAGGDHQGEQRECNANRFVGDAVERIRIREKALQIFAAPQQQQVEQVGEDSANQRRENKRTRGQAGRVEAIRVERGILPIPRAQNEEHESEGLQQNADEKCPVGEREKTLVAPHTSQNVEHQGRCHGGKDQ